MISMLWDAGLPVIIYNGQLDLICATLGVDAWLDKLQWSGLAEFQALQPYPLHASKANRNTAAFVKHYQNLMMFTVMNAGHMIPADQPQAALSMVHHIIDFAEQADKRHSQSSSMSNK